MGQRDRNVFIFGALGILVLFAGFYFLFLSPLLANLDQQAQLREDRQAELDALEQEIARLEEVRRNSPELQRQLLELNRRVPTQPEIETVLVQLEDVATQARVTQTNFDPGDSTSPAGGGDYTVQPITMSFEGTYDELLDFLTRTDNLVRLVTINDVTYTISEEGTTAAPEIEQNLLIEIDAEVYYQPTGVPAGQAPGAPVPPGTTTPAAPPTPAPAQGVTSGG